jgi:hypothetical protein
MSKKPHTATNLALEDKLIEEDRKRGGHRRKKKRVSTTFEESISIQRHQPPPIWAAFATVDFDSSYDYKAERRSKRL